MATFGIVWCFGGSLVGILCYTQLPKWLKGASIGFLIGLSFVVVTMLGGGRVAIETIIPFILILSLGGLLMGAVEASNLFSWSKAIFAAIIVAAVIGSMYFTLIPMNIILQRKNLITQGLLYILLTTLIMEMIWGIIAEIIKKDKLN